ILPLLSPLRRHHSSILSPYATLMRCLAATPEDVQEIHRAIRLELANIFDADIASRVRLLYGGSVTKSNASNLLRQDDIDGLLVGGASLDPGHFLAICQQASEHATAGLTAPECAAVSGFAVSG